MQIPLLQDIVIIFALSALVVFIFQKIKIPPIVGFLVTGLIIGPTGLINFSSGISIIGSENHELEYLAEMGVVLLLFTIGIEFSLKSLIQIRRTVLLGGTLQVGLSIAFAFAISYMLGHSFEEALFMGFLLALSSTAIVLRTLQRNNEIGSFHGKTSLGILIYQDLIIVPMMLFVPILAGTSENISLSLIYLLVKTLILLVVTYAGARWFIPKILHAVAKTGNNELFLLTLLLIGLAVAWLSSLLGLSLALGAFLAGLAISESEYSHHAFGKIIPFRDIFTAFFFVSVGMLLDINFVVSNPLIVLAFVLGVMLIKSIIGGLAAFVLGYPFRTTVIVGLALCQIGEFSFILADMGVKNLFVFDSSESGIFYYQLFLSVTTFTMILTPFIIMLAPRSADIILRVLPIPQKYVNGIRKTPENKPKGIDNHIIIVGLGLNGTNIAKAAKTSKISYLVIESDAELVKEKQAKGEPIIFGDAALGSVLENAEIKKAKVLVCVISDPSKIYTIIRNARQLNNDIYIIARTRHVGDVEDLYKAGADEVIPEEFETSLEIFSRVLNKYLIPRKEIDELVNEFRSYGYESFREILKQHKSLSDLKLQIPDIEISAIEVSEKSEIVGKAIEESGLRERFELSIVALKRGDDIIGNPGKDEIIKAKDLLYVLGSHKDCVCAYAFFKGEEDENCLSN
jgi:CPA2 family monovalent cation:H+ antiporter-2